METLIVLCLLLIITLLAYDKIVNIKKSKQAKSSNNSSSKRPNFIGQTQLTKSRIMSKSIPIEENQLEEESRYYDHFDDENRKIERMTQQIPQKELSQVLINTPNFEEEEEEWNNDLPFDGTIGFAQGASFEELSIIGEFLETKNSKTSHKLPSIDSIQKLQGTELLSLLEDSIEEASHKIAKLLDCTLSSQSEISAVTLTKNSWDNFNIEMYL